MRRSDVVELALQWPELSDVVPHRIWLAEAYKVFDCSRFLKRLNCFQLLAAL